MRSQGTHRDNIYRCAKHDCVLDDALAFASAQLQEAVENEPAHQMECSEKLAWLRQLQPLQERFPNEDCLQI